MFIKQISVGLENVPGQLADLSELLGKEGRQYPGHIGGRHLRGQHGAFVVDEPAKALNILNGHELQVYENRSAGS